MSMPQYIEIAVVASNEDGLEPIRGSTVFSKAGIAPRYKLVTLQQPKHSCTTQLGNLEPSRVGLWVALDDESLRGCEEFYGRLSSQPGYSRGFYDLLLPVAVLRVSGPEEFGRVTEKVLEAFYESS